MPKTLQTETRNDDSGSDDDQSMRTANKSNKSKSHISTNKSQIEKVEKRRKSMKVRNNLNASKLSS